MSFPVAVGTAPGRRVVIPHLAAFWRKDTTGFKLPKMKNTRLKPHWRARPQQRRSTKLDLWGDFQGHHSSAPMFWKQGAVGVRYPCPVRSGGKTQRCIECAGARAYFMPPPPSPEPPELCIDTRRGGGGAVCCHCLHPRSGGDQSTVAAHHTPFGLVRDWKRSEPWAWGVTPGMLPTRGATTTRPDATHPPCYLGGGGAVGGGGGGGVGMSPWGGGGLAVRPGGGVPKRGGAS